MRPGIKKEIGESSLLPSASFLFYARSEIENNLCREQQEHQQDDRADDL